MTSFHWIRGKCSGAKAVVAFALLLLAVGLCKSALAGPIRGGGTVHELFRAPYPGTPGSDVVVIRVDYGPGDTTPPHYHPGFVYAYVLKGAVVSGLGDAAPQTYRQGQMWSEVPWQPHMVSRNASSTEPARILVAFIIPERAPLTVIIPPPAGTSKDDR
jgi:quercetin dioxygenase-like cupin family protein